jgi:hypothetical protein
MIQHRQLRFDIRKWIVSKLMPRKYGNTAKMQTGEALEPHQPSIIEIVISQDAERKARGM